MRQLVHTIEQSDVGCSTIRVGGRVRLVTDFMGRILPGDVGKRIFEIDGILQVENDEQLRRRQAGGKS